MDDIRSVVAFSMPIAWMTLILNQMAPLRKINVLTTCILGLSILLSGIAFRNGNLIPALRFFLSPLLHADYLHLCLNVLGGFLVIGRLEETNGPRQTAVLLSAAYVCQVILVAFYAFVVRLPIDILGLSCIVFAALGCFVHQQFRRLSNAQKSTFVISMVLMGFLEVSVRTAIVHYLAFMLGLIMSLALGKVEQET